MSDRNKNKTNNNNLENIKNIYDLNPYELFYLLTSDNLHINDEKTIIMFMYKYICFLSNTDISMIFHGIRIQHIDLKVLFNFARDHERIKANDYFKKRLCF